MKTLADLDREDAIAAATDAARTAYFALVAALTEAENVSGVYLTDENVDAQNALDSGEAYDTLGFWETCYRSARASADFRAEEAGINLLLA